MESKYPDILRKLLSISAIAEARVSDTEQESKLESQEGFLLVSVPQELKENRQFVQLGQDLGSDPHDYTDEVDDLDEDVMLGEGEGGALHNVSFMISQKLVQVRYI